MMENIEIGHHDEWNINVKIVQTLEDTSQRGSSAQSPQGGLLNHLAIHDWVGKRNTDFNGVSSSKCCRLYALQPLVIESSNKIGD
jgi:hypothetical protein